MSINKRKETSRNGKRILLHLLFPNKNVLQYGVKNQSQDGKSSKYLIFHCHGGGFAAQSPKSHEIYLREWAVKLNIPILSVDYTLSLEAPFPRAVEDVFYAYCWALKNPKLVGSTCENIVFVGDSAGANLNTVCAVKCIEMGIPKPKGIFNIYGVFSIGLSIAPARFLNLIDPVLPIDFTTRLSRSYCEEHENLDLNANHQKIQDGTASEGLIREKKQKIVEPLDFNFKLQNNYFVSPHHAPDDVLRDFPPTRLLSTNFDPCLDDSIEFGKKLKTFNVDVQVDVLDGLPHGFLYFDQVV